ncbi:triple gene block 2 [Lagenaria mild mosaic virus]|uniref:Triple gene block 2 n=1 Tax=Lagenaria mild mosaic virus TaxID=717848 RepID=E0D4K2_9VIRU|nr:triple gene block 2 [Lagenaria mild mosaic virus]BAJ17499.1 triple gene block 2 [Lagenaria mild mosaic virus]
MSGRQGFLTPPPDHSKTFLALAVGVALALVIHSLLSYRLPTPGDNIHSLPFGGSYIDGTKRIFYNSPRAQSPSSKIWALGCIAVCLSLLHVFKTGDRTRSSSSCNCTCCT